MASTHLPTKPIAVVDRDNDGLVVEDDLESSLVPAYRYEPLPKQTSFRLLQLRAGGPENPLECNTSTHDMDAPTLPSYYAMSYTWGSSIYDRLVIAGRSIPLDDELHSRYSIRHPLGCDGRRLLISTNLRNALRRFRHLLNPVTLWIDAICINQEDIHERASQVLLMKTIYYNAQCVWLWLGEEMEGSSSAFELLSQLARMGKSARFNKEPLPSIGDIGDADVCDELGIPNLYSFEWKSVVKLFDRPVFRRIWIIQEVVTSRETLVFCGSSASATLTDILEGTLFLRNTGFGSAIDSRYGSGKNHMEYLIELCKYQLLWALHHSDLRWELMSGTRRCQASDPRDKIFAIIGLFRDFARDLALSEAASKSGITTEIEIPSRSIDKEAIRSLWTSSIPRMHELHRLISNLLGLHAEVLTAIVKEEKFSEIEVQLHRKTRDRIVLDIFRRLVDEVVLTREWKQVAIFFTRLIYVLDTFSNSWDDFFSETKTNGVVSGIRLYLEFFDKICQPASQDNEIIYNTLKGIAKSSQASSHNLQISDRLADAIQIDDSITFQAFSKSLQRPLPWSVFGLTMPDYSKTVEEVYLEFTLCCIKEDENLDILSAVEDRSMTKCHKLPSWVPDYSVDMNYRLLRSTTDKVDYASSSSTTSDFRWSIDDPKLLRVDGYQIDQISDITSMESASRFLGNNAAFEWKSFVENSGSTYVNGELIHDVLWRTLVGGCIDTDKCDDMRESFRAFMVIQEVLKEDPQSSQEIDDILERKSIDPDEFREYTGKLRPFQSEIHHSRRLFRTQNGFLGLGPMSAKVGDVVCIFKGGRVPYVIRKIPDGSSYFNFIGDCYVHAIMHGEAVDSGCFTWSEIGLL
jgi:hypothetical protein